MKAKENINPIPAVPEDYINIVPVFPDRPDYSVKEILDKDGCPTGKRKLRDTSAGLKALESLCKYLGFQKEDEDYKEAKIITISNLDDSKI